MSPHHTPSSAADRLLDELASVGTLELLLLLHQASPTRRRVDEICEALRCPPSWAQLQLERLREVGLVAGDAEDGYVYVPGSPRTAAAVGEIVGLWHKDRRALTRRMLQSPRVRRRGRRPSAGRR